jgi:hypothetical protein
MNEHEQAFTEKMQRLRHTGVGGQTAPSYEAFPSNNVKTRSGDRADISMKVEKGWVVANPISRRRPSRGGHSEKKKIHDGPVKVFALTNMDKPQPQKVAEVIVNTSSDTEESIIKEIIVLQKKLAALKAK